MTCRGCSHHYEHCSCERPYKQAHAGSHPVRILDVLETEGSWMTAYELADRLGLGPEIARKAVLRLQARGLLERRIRDAHRQLAEWRLA